jgi:hypothetical protein
MVYDLQNLCGKDIRQLYNKDEIDEDSLLNSLKLTIKKWSNNDKVYKIIRYNKSYLSDDLIRTSGLFRSVILNNDGKIISFAPPKSLRPDNFIKLHEDEMKQCIAERYIEGTMINLFYDGEWEMTDEGLVIKGNLDLFETEIKSLGNLIFVGGDLDLQGTKIESLGNLTSVGGILRLRNTSIESLGDLTHVGRHLNLMNTPIKSLGNLTHVGGNLFLENTPIESFGNLKSVGGNLDIFLTPISKKYSVKEIIQMVNVGGTLFM